VVWTSLIWLVAYSDSIFGEQEANHKLRDKTMINFLAAFKLESFPGLTTQKVEWILTTLYGAFSCGSALK
jgi:hypothetical protein